MSYDYSGCSLLYFCASGTCREHVLIAGSVDESKLVTLAGNTRPEAMMKQFDRGPVADSYPMEHMMLQLKRSAEQERELEALIDQLHDSSSPNFHRWLAAKEFGERFGLSQQDLDTITRWLESHGFKVNVVYENGLLIDFSGTAEQIRNAFHTEIHQLNVKGQEHVANVSDPQIPAALAAAVIGVVSMHDFKPHAMYKPKADYTFTAGGGTYYAVVPADLATIYNLNPLFKAGLTGQGQTIVLIEDTDLYSTTDWDTFRSVFGLSSYTGGSLTQVHPHPPSGPNNCIDPHVNVNDDDEAALDVEYASAAAPSAAIELASCLDTSTFGGLIAIQNLLNASSAPPAVISMSYGECETGLGASANAAFNAAYQQAVTEGSRCMSPPEMMGHRAAPATGIGQHTELGSTVLPQLRTTSPSAARTLATRMQVPTALIGAPRIQAFTDQRCPISPRFPGTIPAPASYWPNPMGTARPMATMASVTVQMEWPIGPKGAAPLQAAGGLADAPQENQRNLVLSAGRAPDMRSPRGNRWPECPTTEFGIFPIFRSLPPTEFGDTIIHSALAIRIVVLLVLVHRIAGLAAEAHRLPLPSWPAFRL